MKNLRFFLYYHIVVDFVHPSTICEVWNDAFIVSFFYQLASKRDPEREKECQGWVETVLGAKFPPSEAFEDVLKDGTVLCQLINKLKPGSVNKINTSGGQFKMMENITK